MGDPTAEFFDDLSRRNFDARVQTVRGTVSFDIRGDAEEPSQWFVVINNGKITVSREPREADCVVHSSHADFNRILSSGDNAVTALLRGAAIADGDLRLLLQFQRLLPAPPGRDPRDRRPASGGGE